MIHYELRCADGHGFDGWFRGSAAFDQQAEAGLLQCPVCASPRVSRALMAPHVGRTPARAQPPEKAAPESAAPESAASQSAASQSAAPQPAAPKRESSDIAVAAPSPMPDQLRAALQRIRAEIERKCDYVGPHFAEKARAMHEGDLAPAAIYGETTPEQARALVEDGIEVARIPWVPRADG